MVRRGGCEGEGHEAGVVDGTKDIGLLHKGGVQWLCPAQGGWWKVCLLLQLSFTYHHQPACPGSGFGSLEVEGEGGGHQAESRHGREEETHLRGLLLSKNGLI